MHDMLCKCKCKIPPSNALEITLDSWQSNFHTRRADVSQIPFFVWILYYFNGTAEAQLEVAILSYLTKFGGFLPSRNRDNGKQFLGGETFPSVNPSRQISRKPAAVISFCSSKCSFEVKLVIWPKEVELNPRVRCAFGNVLLFRLKIFVVNSLQG